MALVGPRNAPSYRLDGYDAFLAAVIAGRRPRRLVATAALEASRSAVVLFAFPVRDRPARPRSNA